LIDSEVYYEYNREIRNASDYEDLLRWLRNGGHEKPGVAAPAYNRHNTTALPPTGVMPFNLFFPEMGYTRLTSIHPNTIMPNDGGVQTVWMDSQGHFHEIVDMQQEATIALMRFADWREDGLIEFVRNWNDLQPDYATILVDISRMPGMDLSGYNMIILSEPALGATVMGSVAVASHGTDVSEFMRFLIWLEDPDNYAWFYFGREGEDHARDPVTGLIIDLVENRFHIRDGRQFFRNNEFNSMLTVPSPYRPVGFQQEMNNLTVAVPPLSNTGARWAFEQWNPIGGSLSYLSNLQERYTQPVIDLLSDLCFSPSPDVSHNTQLFFAHVRQLRYAGQLSEILNEARRR
jgi:hypothetical protein